MRLEPKLENRRRRPESSCSREYAVEHGAGGRSEDVRDRKGRDGEAGGCDHHGRASLQPFGVLGASCRRVRSTQTARCMVRFFSVPPHASLYPELRGDTGPSAHAEGRPSGGPVSSLDIASTQRDGDHLFESFGDGKVKPSPCRPQNERSGTPVRPGKAGSKG